MSEETKADLYGNAIAYIHPQVEDFGITAVEAMAAGKPVIALGKVAQRKPSQTESLNIFEAQCWGGYRQRGDPDLIRPCFRHPSSARTPNPCESKISRNHARVHRIRHAGKRI